MVETLEQTLNIKIHSYMKLRIVTSMLTIVTVLSTLAATSRAFFTDSGNSSDNLFTTGDLNMKLTDANESAADDVSATFGISGGGPGTTFSSNLDIKNTGSVEANHVSFQFANLVTESGTAPGNALTVYMDNVIRVTALNWDSDTNGVADYDILTLIPDSNLNGIIDLDDVETSGVISNVPYGGVQGTDHRLHIEGQYDPTRMTSEHMGDTVNTTLTVTMTQA